ncbi:MAG: hypothetical protein V2A67_05495 [Bacteroidota bacterium]
MKANGLIKLLVVALITLGMTAPANADDIKNSRKQKKSVTLTIDTPIIDFISKIYGDQFSYDDAYRVQRFLAEVDHITISFKDEDDLDYVLVFKELDNQQLEQWMFDEGYLSTEPQSTPIEAWMQNPHYLQ